MSGKKRKVVISDGMVLFGLGQKTIVKYLVSSIPEKSAFKVQLIGERGRASSFICRLTQFYEGDTLYKHGYRMYKHSAQLEKKYVAYLVRHNLHGKLKKIHRIMERINNLSMQKMLALSMVFDNMLERAEQIDRRIKKM